MSEARKRILTMLAEGKITVEQSEELLGALESDLKTQKPEASESSVPPQDKKSSLGEDMSHMANQFQNQMREAVKNMEPHTKEIKTKIKSLGGWLQNTVGGMMKDFAFNNVGPVDGLEVAFAIPQPPNFSSCQTCQIDNPYGLISVKEGPEFSLQVKGKISKSALAGEPPLDWFMRNLFRFENETLQLGFERAAGFKAVLNLEMTLPSSLLLKIKTVSATTKIRGAFPVESVISISGDIILSNVTLQDASLDTVSGEMELNDATISGSAKGTSGDIALKGCTIQKFSIQTVSGDILIERPTVSDSTVCSALSTSGDIRVKKPNGTIGRIEANTRTGQLQIDWGTPTQETSRHGMVMELNPIGAEIKAESISGDITLD